ncbi:uncharacterized protein ACMZJ9_012896 [Mantella aurantiaca]
MDEREQLAEAILNHALEIFCLLTVEDFIVVKRPPDGTRSTFSIRATDNIISGSSSGCPELLFTLLGMEDKTQKMIAELANRIVRLLTREVPVKCEDVAVYFSKDEWEYLEGHGARYEKNQDTCIIEQPSAPGHHGTEKSFPVTSHIKQEPDEELQPATDGTSTLPPSGFIPGSPEVKPLLSTVNIHRPFMEAQTSSSGYSFISSCDIKSEPGDMSSDDTIDSVEEESPQFPSSPDREHAYNITDHIKEEPEESNNLYMSVSGDTMSKDQDMDYLPLSTNYKRARTCGIRSEKTSLPCEVCGKVLGRKATLEKHLQIHTGERPFVCNECGQRFSCKSHLTAHERSHSGERPYICNQCGQRFFKQQHLVLHQVVHTGEKPFSCPVCGKGFTRQSSVLKHSSMHAEQKPFVCTECGKSYCQYASLIVHQRQHSGEKPFVCKHCERGFTCKDTMLKHQRAHTGEKPFSCPLCNKCFIDQSTLSKHKRKVHAKDPKPANEPKPA